MNREQELECPNSYPNSEEHEEPGSTVRLDSQPNGLYTNYVVRYPVRTKPQTKHAESELRTRESRCSPMALTPTGQRTLKKTQWRFPKCIIQRDSVKNTLRRKKKQDKPKGDRRFVSTRWNNHRPNPSIRLFGGFLTYAQLRDQAPAFVRIQHMWRRFLKNEHLRNELWNCSNPSVRYITRHEQSTKARVIQRNL